MENVVITASLFGGLNNSGLNPIFNYNDLISLSVGKSGIGPGF